MFKSTDMVETGLGYGYCMFRQSDAGIKHNILAWFDSGIVTPEMFTKTWLGMTELVDWLKRLIGV